MSKVCKYIQKIRLLLIIVLLFGFMGAVAQNRLPSKAVKSSVEERSHSVFSEQLAPAASWVGTHYMERVGFSLSGVGDVNKDGYADFAIGAPHTNPTDPDPSHRDAGSVYLILGKPTGLQYDVSLDGGADAHFWGKFVFDAVGAEIGTKGDINGDEYGDILIGAPSGNSETNPGYAFLIFGNESADWGTNFILRDQADASFYGETSGHLAGNSVDIIGDLNDDGYDEFLIGAEKASDIGNDAGKIYLFKGSAQGWQRETPITQAFAIFHGTHNDGRAGKCVRGVGDVNGDGIPDFAIGAWEHEVGGRVYLIFGRSSMNWGTQYSLDDADVIFTGENYLQGYGKAGFKIAAAGDLNGDHIDDFLIGDFGYEVSRGKVYIIFGKNTGWNDIDLSASDASYAGEARDDWAGFDIDGNFDYNNDGYADFLVGSPYNDFNGEIAGLAYLIDGRQDNWQNGQSLLFNNGYRLGLPDDEMGHAVAGIGDFNGDGGGDFVFSAIRNSDGGWVGSLFGKVLLFLGEKAYETVKGSVDYVTGAPVADVVINVDGVPETTTDASAEYSLQLKVNLQHTVIPTKTEGEDVGQLTFSSWDAVLAARHAIGLATLDATQRKLADVDEDSKVTMNDAVHIARYAVGITSGPTRAGEWVFDPASRFYEYIDQILLNEDYTAYLMGDVDANWTASLPMAKGAGGPIPAIVSNAAVQDDGTIILGLSLEDGFPLLSFDMVISFNREALDYVGLVDEGNGDHFQVFSHMDEGTIRLGGFSVEPMEEAGELLVMKFKVRDENRVSESVVLERYQLNEHLVQESLLLFDEEWIVADRFRLLHNYPNPFNSRTTLEFRLPAEDRVRVVVYDRRGRIVREIADRKFGAGGHQLTWDGTDAAGRAVATGLYLISVTSSTAARNVKALYVK